MVSGGLKAASQHLCGGHQGDRVLHDGRRRGKLKQEVFCPDISKKYLYNEDCQALEQITQIALPMSLEVFKA